MNPRALLALLLSLCTGVLASEEANTPLTLEIEEVLANGQPVAFDHRTGVTLPAGRHDLEFRIRTRGSLPDAWLVKHQLEGYDPAWRAVGGEMETIARFIDPEGNAILEQHWAIGGSSPDWAGTAEETRLIRRSEPLFVPANVAWLELEFNSGTQAAITGVWCVDDLTVNRSGGSLELTKDLWHNTGFSALQPGTGPFARRTFAHWARQGDHSIPQISSKVTQRGKGPVLALFDSSSTSSGAWVSRQRMPDDLKAGEVLSIAWRECYRVGMPGVRAVSYRGVPPGNLEFKLIGCGAGGVWLGVGTSLPVTIRPHLWSRPWFWPAVAAIIAAAASLGVWAIVRHRYQRRLAKIEMAHALEVDRTRIARDIHDDVGAQLTRLTLLSALIEGGEKQPEKLNQHIGEIASTTRQLVNSMDEIVWAVDPGNDTLDHLGNYLCRFADEFFSESGVRIRFDVPPIFPAVPLTAEVRHNLFLAVKEVLNNSLKHGHAAEVRLSLAITSGALDVNVRDDGLGFDADHSASGHGLLNMKRRMEEIGGHCRIESSPGGGTRVTLRCPLPPHQPISA